MNKQTRTMELVDRHRRLIHLANRAASERSVLSSSNEDQRHSPMCYKSENDRRDRRERESDKCLTLEIHCRHFLVDRRSRNKSSASRTMKRSMVNYLLRSFSHVNGRFAGTRLMEKIVLFCWFCLQKRIDRSILIFGIVWFRRRRKKWWTRFVRGQNWFGERKILFVRIFVVRSTLFNCRHGWTGLFMVIFFPLIIATRQELVVS